MLNPVKSDGKAIMTTKRLRACNGLCMYQQQSVVFVLGVKNHVILVVPCLYTGDEIILKCECYHVTKRPSVLLIIRR